MYTTIHLIRHGHTEFTGAPNSLGQSDSDRVAGSTDVALSLDGERAALEFGQRSDLAGIEQVFSSPLQRAQVTAELVSQRQPQQDPRLAELDFGVWEGLRWQEVHDRWPDEMAAWGQDWVNIAPPEGESFLQLAERANHWLTETLADCHGQSMLACAHAGTIRAILCSALKLPLANAMSFSIDYVHVVSLVERDGHIRCLRLNADRL